MNLQFLRLTITKKVMLPFLLVLALMAALSAVCLVSYETAGKSIALLQEESRQQAAMSNLHFSLSSLLMAVNDYIITGNQKYNNEYEGFKRELDERIINLRELELSVDERAQTESIRANVNKINELAEKILQLRIAQANVVAGRMMEEMDYRYGDSTYGEVSRMLEVNVNEVKAAGVAVESQRRIGFTLIVGSSGLAILIAVAVGWLTVKHISRPVVDLVKMAERISSRDFSTKLKPLAMDEIGMLTVAFNAMADEINRRYEELENFAYIVAHDLKNPVVGIQGISEILATDYAPRLDASAKENLDLIINSTKHMASLINDLLEFARAGKVEFEREPVSMDKMLGEIKRELTLFAGDRKAIIELTGNLPAILCDPIRFSQVWKNLIGNAVKYNDKPSPRIEIGLEAAKDPQKSYQFYVKDDGIGIDVRHFETIFMPFKRATTSKKYEGTGIGLAIVKRVIDFHGGRIWLTSKLGEGTVFHFTVPKPLAGA